MKDITIAIEGRVASDPELKAAKRTNRPFASFRMASTPRRRVSGAQEVSYEDGETSWFTVYAFGNLGANVLRSIEKGQPVLVTGRLTAREFTREDGSHGTTVSVTANSVGHDLNFGQAAYDKVAKPTYSNGESVDDAVREAEEDSHDYRDSATTPYEIAEQPSEMSGQPRVAMAV